MDRSSRTLVLGHRGASADHPENTADAFRGAVAQGADGVELDVRLNSVGELIVHHDAWYPDGRSVWDVALAAAAPGTCGLAEVLDICVGLLVNVEIKNNPDDLGGHHVPYSHDVADAVVDLIERRSARDRVLVSSFDAPTLERVVERSPDLPTGFLVPDPGSSPDLLERIAAAGHDAVHPWDPCVDAAMVERCAAVGLAVNTWTVNDADRAVELAGFGVAALITDAPQRICAALHDPSSSTPEGDARL